jgi:hypothetical protein
MIVISDIDTREEFDELKTVMEVFIVNKRLKEIVRGV